MSNWRKTGFGPRRMIWMALFLSLSLSGAVRAEKGGSPIAPLADDTLIDQDGHDVRFASDVLGDRVVAIDFIYTSCGTLCPLASANFQHLQKLLGRRLGKDVRLVSISLDPVHDTPPLLKRYAARFRATAHWVWLTGPLANVEHVLTSLGAKTTDFRNHAPLIVIGDAATGEWIRFNALASPVELKTQIDQLLMRRKTR